MGHTVEKIVNDKEPDKSPDEAGVPADGKAPSRNTTFASNAFDVINYGGLNFLLNSALSLAITYNVMSTEKAKKFVAGIGNGIKPIVSGWSNLKNKIGVGEKVSPAIRSLRISESARSASETLVMMIAGFVLLIPMKILEDNKKKVVDKIDRWKNREYHKYCEENNLEPEKLPYEEKEKKSGWGQLISARIAGLVSVLGIDAVIQNFNNKRMEQKKGNLDTVEWKLGRWLYEKLPKPITEKFVDFFSMSKASNLSGIQPAVLERLKETVGHDEKKMIFSEQMRFVSKEFSLTAIFSLIMYGLVKTGFIGSALNKLGFKKEKEQQKVIDDILPDVPLVPISKGKVDLDGDGIVDSEKKYTDKIKPVEKSMKEKSGGGFVNKYNSEQAALVQPAL